MGACWCLQKCSVSGSEEPVEPETFGMNLESPMVLRVPDVLTSNNNHSIRLYILQMVDVVGSFTQGYDQHPVPLMELHLIAEDDEGWERVINALVSTVPLDHPLGPSAITLIFDDCPLPSTNTVLQTIEGFNLCRERAAACKSQDAKLRERNLLVVLGSFAEKFAGPISIRILKENIMDYIYAFLIQIKMPDMVLQAICAVEKFGKTRDNKCLLQQYFENQERPNPLVVLARRYRSDNLVWHQVGFCAQWLLDNMFIIEGRALSYTQLDMSGINAMLDINNTTDLLKISADGLEARCDAHTFESVRCTFEVTQDCYYYEAEILTPGVMQIGWATKETKFSNHEGYGIGDDQFSLAYDGCRRLIWHKAVAKNIDAAPWTPGDILGCLLDVNRQEAVFYLNGEELHKSNLIFIDSCVSSRVGFYAAASFMSCQGARFNFGNRQFRYKPRRRFHTFNDFGILTDVEKEVIPRWLNAERLRATTNNEVDLDTTCTICYDREANTVFSPCRHAGFCRDCALQLAECPLCRERVWYYTVSRPL